MRALLLQSTRNLLIGRRDLWGNLRGRTPSNTQRGADTEVLKYPLENLVAGSVYRADPRLIDTWIAPTIETKWFRVSN